MGGEDGEGPGGVRGGLAEDGRGWSIGNGDWRVSEALPKVLSLKVIRKDIVQKTRTLKKPWWGLLPMLGGPQQ